MPVSASTYRDGASIPGLYPATQSGVLAATVAASGVPTPENLNANIVPMTRQTVTLLPPNPNRNYLLIFNPAVIPAQFSMGIATQGALGNLSIGPGEAYFWATAQGLAPVYQGALTAIGLYPGLPLWVWEDGTDIYNDGGVLAFRSAPSALPTSFDGLPPGGVWNNGLTLAIVPGLAFTGPSVFFAGQNSTSLSHTTGANYPTTPPPAGSGQLWSVGGTVAIA